MKFIMARRKIMKEKIHPNYRVVLAKCSTCGKEYEVGTTAKDVKIDVCANCHPFYTGKQTFVAKAGRVEKFYDRQAKVQQPKETVKKKSKKNEEVEEDI
jgi:large subunit ribosomal protein L31